jgi:hypothetical protein
MVLFIYRHRKSLFRPFVFREPDREFITAVDEPGKDQVTRRGRTGYLFIHFYIKRLLGIGLEVNEIYFLRKCRLLQDNKDQEKDEFFHIPVLVVSTKIIQFPRDCLTLTHANNSLAME